MNQLLEDQDGIILDRENEAPIFCEANDNIVDLSANNFERLQQEALRDGFKRKTRYASDVKTLLDPPMQNDILKTFSALMSPDELSDNVVVAQMVNFQTLLLDPHIRIRSIGLDIHQGQQISFYTSYEPDNKREAMLAITMYHLNTTNHARLDYFKDYCLDEDHLGDPITDFKFSSILNGGIIAGCIVTESGYWMVVTDTFNKVIRSECLLKIFRNVDRSQVIVKSVKIGLEGAYFSLKNGQSTKMEFEEGNDKPTFKLPQQLNFSNEDVLVNSLTERFIRSHAELFSDLNLTNGVLALVHGSYLSLCDFSSAPFDSKLQAQPERQWVHFKNTISEKHGRLNQRTNECWSFQKKAALNEIKSIHFMNINQRQCITYMLLFNGQQKVKQVIYYPNMNKIIANSSVFTPQKNCKRYKSTFIFANLEKIIRIHNHFNSDKYKSQGDAQTLSYLEVRESQESPLDIFRTTQTSQIVLFARNLLPTLTMPQINGAPTNLLFLYDTGTHSLKVYNIPKACSILSQKDLDLLLSEEMPNFPYKPSHTYYYQGAAVHFLEKGDLVRVKISAADLSPAKQFTYSTNGYINNIHMLDQSCGFVKDKLERTYFFDLSLLGCDLEYHKGPRMISLVEDAIGKTLIQPIFSGHTKRALQSKIVGDPLQGFGGMFIDPYKVACVPNLSEIYASCDGSHNFSGWTLGFNTKCDIQSPSEFNQTLSAWDNEKGIIKTWSMGSGKVIQIYKVPQEIHEKYKDFKFFNQWDGFNLAKRQSTDKAVQFIKFQVNPTGVIIASDFLHKQELGSNVFVSNDNRLLLEINSFMILVHQLAMDNGILSTKLLIFIRNMLPQLLYPLYFTADFQSYVDFCATSKFLTFYTLPRSTDGEQLLKKEYVKYEPLNVPEQQKILIDKETGLMMFEYMSSTRIRYVNQHGIEQEVPIDLEIEGRGHLVKERSIHGQRMGLAYFSRYRDVQAQTRDLLKLQDHELVALKCRQTKLRFSGDGSALAVENKDHYRSVAIPCNLRILQSYTFQDWKIMEALSEENCSLNYKDLSRFTRGRQIQILNSVLPSGDTLLHSIIQGYCDNLVPFLSYVKSNQLEVIFLQNLKGINPLHYCVRDKLTMNASRLLQTLKDMPLNDHSHMLITLFPDLLKLSPVALGDYMDSRLVRVPWTPCFTDGKLKHEQGSDFAVLPMNLFPLQEKEMKQGLFDSSEQYGNLKLPVNIVLSDIPELHQFGSKIGTEFLKSLSSSKHSAALFGRRYLQALVEVKWPPIRRTLMVKIFLPYLAYLLLFSFYSLYLVFNEQKGETVLKLIVEISLIVLSVLSLCNEGREYMLEPTLYLKHFWNYLDVLPKLGVLLSVFSDMLGGIFTDSESAYDLTQQLNSVCIFCLSINLLNYLRYFRKTGYLIHLIIQVMVDMKYFVMIVCITLLSFTGAFYILSRSNPPGPDDFLDSSFPTALAFTYQLLLGAFSPEEFGATNLGLTWMFFVGATFFLIVVMLNLLISIISATFQEVQSQALQRMYFEFAQLIVENSHLLSHEAVASLDARGSYMYVAWLEDSVTSGVHEAAERDQKLREAMEHSFKDLASAVKASEERQQKSMEQEMCMLYKKVVQLQEQVKELRGAK